MTTARHTYADKFQGGAVKFDGQQAGGGGPVGGLSLWSIGFEGLPATFTDNEILDPAEATDISDAPLLGAPAGGLYLAILSDAPDVTVTINGGPPDMLLNPADAAAGVPGFQPAGAWIVVVSTSATPGPLVVSSGGATISTTAVSVLPKVRWSSPSSAQPTGTDAEFGMADTGTGSPFTAGVTYTDIDTKPMVVRRNKLRRTSGSETFNVPLTLVRTDGLSGIKASLYGQTPEAGTHTKVIEFNGYGSPESFPSDNGTVLPIFPSTLANTVTFSDDFEGTYEVSVSSPVGELWLAKKDGSRVLSRAASEATGLVVTPNVNSLSASDALWTGLWEGTPAGTYTGETTGTGTATANIPGITSTVTVADLTAALAYVNANAMTGATGSLSASATLTEYGVGGNSDTSSSHTFSMSLTPASVSFSSNSASGAAADPDWGWDALRLSTSGNGGNLTGSWSSPWVRASTGTALCTSGPPTGIGPALGSGTPAPSGTTFLRRIGDFSGGTCAAGVGFPGGPSQAFDSAIGPNLEAYSMPQTYIAVSVATKTAVRP